jgi:hypothetical protein
MLKLNVQRRDKCRISPSNRSVVTQLKWCIKIGGKRTEYPEKMGRGRTDKIFLSSAPNPEEPLI